MRPRLQQKTLRLIIGTPSSKRRSGSMSLLPAQRSSEYLIKDEFIETVAARKVQKMD